MATAFGALQINASDALEQGKPAEFGLLIIEIGIFADTSDSKDFWLPSHITRF
jgi:hypothetical protein